MSEGWRDRIVNEQSELTNRLNKLQTFLKSEEFGTFGATQQHLLLEQEKVMLRYQEILELRLQ